jgi:hypothetical protein
MDRIFSGRCIIRRVIETLYRIREEAHKEEKHNSGSTTFITPPVKKSLNPWTGFAIGPRWIF